jgi:hypothetical protein
VAGYAADIADAIRWPYDLALDVAFADAGLLDRSGRLAGWSELNGWLVQRAEKDRARHRNKGKNLDQRGSVGRTEGRTVGRAEVPRGFHGASAEDRSRRKPK